MFRQAGFRLLLYFGDLALIAIAMSAASWLRIQWSIGSSLDESAVWLSLPVYALGLASWGIGFPALDVYNLRKNLRLADELSRLSTAYAATVLAFAGALYFSFREISRLQVIYFAGLGWLLLAAYRVLFRLVLRAYSSEAGHPWIRRVLIVGAGPLGREIADTVLAHHWTGLRLIGFVDDNPEANTSLAISATNVRFPNFGSIARAAEIAKEQRIDEAIFALPSASHDEMVALIATLQQMKIGIRVAPNIERLAFLGSTIEDFGGQPLITLRAPVLDPMQRVIKRIFDLAVSTVTLVVAAPLLLLIAVAIKLTSRGPIIFRQARVGQHGRPFQIYKFRTMEMETEASAVPRRADGTVAPVHKIPNDPRVTPLGRWLRRLSLDELPQLFNVLRGEMSLVGPRPELPWLVDQYQPWQRRRFDVPQGMTGWWQINGRSEKLMHLHTEEDLYYIQNYSLWLDIRILFGTLRVVLSRRGAY